MKRSPTRGQACWHGGKAMLLAASVALTLAACGEGPGNPMPPKSPPRPVTEAAQISALVAGMVFPVRHFSNTVWHEVCLA
ncbi:MAG TPA: hypothetical protein VM571_01280 [Noviherbaspirillum sp.]|nr:hypothetical protein [Noviherbaspirillum sp.]